LVKPHKKLSLTTGKLQIETNGMIKLRLTLLIFITSAGLFAQSIDDPFPVKKMKKDWEVFKDIRKQANSGLYKYRTKNQMDSVYAWAEKEINTSTRYIDFYNIICQVTDFEGSCHNETNLPSKYRNSLRKETWGYFPYPIKWIDGSWRINFKGGKLPVGAKILSINQIPITEITQHLYKYYSTDGTNTTGKRIGIRTHFSKYFRWQYGRKKNFRVKYRPANSALVKIDTLESVSYSDYYRNFNSRHSRPFDQIYYADLKENQKYKYNQLSPSTGLLTIHAFDMGNETSTEHKTYARFLDSIFRNIKENNTRNLIVDVRQNGGGTDPNDLITYSYLTQRNFQENKEAWIQFEKIPLVRHIDSWLPPFFRPLFVGKYNKKFQKAFPLEKAGRYYQDSNSPDHQIRKPNKNAFTGQIYLLISPAVASAGSLFAAMVAGNENTMTIGEETMGGYYGHNGHTAMTYILPKSKIEITFSVVNLEQDVPEKTDQIYSRGIMPDWEVSQSYRDFLTHSDTQMAFTRKWITRKGNPDAHTE